MQLLNTLFPLLASFSALGVLVCFGGASLSLSTQLLNHEGSRKKAVSLHQTSMPYPKTLADLMVAERMWSEQLALKAIEEAQVSELEK